MILFMHMTFFNLTIPITIIINVNDTIKCSYQYEAHCMSKRSDIHIYYCVTCAKFLTYELCTDEALTIYIMLPFVGLTLIGTWVLGWVGSLYIVQIHLRKETNLKMRFLPSMICILPIYNTSSIDLLTVKMLRKRIEA